MFKKILVVIFALLFWTSCRNTGEIIVNSQTKSTVIVNTSQANANKVTSETNNETFAKAFITKSKFDDSTGNIVYTDRLIEFKVIDSKGISIFAESKKIASLKLETNNPKVRADFLEQYNERFFVVVAGSSGTGTCGDATFVIVKIDENLNVKISKPNETNCQGEQYSLNLENVNFDKSMSYYRQISIGDLKFNLESFEWAANKK